MHYATQAQSEGSPTNPSLSGDKLSSRVAETLLLSCKRPASVCHIWYQERSDGSQSPCFSRDVAAAGMPLRPTLSFGRGRDGLVTPGGTDLMAVVNRNADKLRVLQNMPEGGSTEALDQFLSTFAAQSSQVNWGKLN
jgi:hypothetical protein